MFDVCAAPDSGSDGMLAAAGGGAEAAGAAGAGAAGVSLPPHPLIKQIPKQVEMPKQFERDIHTLTP